MRPFILVGLALLFLVVSAMAQSPNSANTLRLDEGQSPAAAQIEDLGWIAGSWRAESPMGISDETWTRPLHGTMAGAFKLSSPEGVQFYEFLELRELEGSLVYRVKHFDADLRGWEAQDESVDFPLVRLEENAAFFSGLTYRLRDDGFLEVFVVVDGEGEEVQELSFAFRRLNDSSD